MTGQPTASACCPTCGGTATLSLREGVDPVGGDGGHVVEFSCVNSCPAPGPAALLCLWAAVRGAAYVPAER